MVQAVQPESIKQLFTEARSHHAWLPKTVPDELLRSIYDIAKWGPTSMNSSPMRIVFVKSAAEKEKLYGALMGSNVAQVRQAPVTAIIAYDGHFQDQLPRLFPAFNAKPIFDDNEALAYHTAFRNSSLQGAYFMLAARGLGLDIGPMSGFDNDKVDAAFFAGTTWKSNFLVNLGYADNTKVYPRGPRLSFEESARIV